MSVIRKQPVDLHNLPFEQSLDSTSNQLEPESKNTLTHSINSFPEKESKNVVLISQSVTSAIPSHTDTEKTSKSDNNLSPPISNLILSKKENTYQLETRIVKDELNFVVTEGSKTDYDGINGLEALSDDTKTSSCPVITSSNTETFDNDWEVTVSQQTALISSQREKILKLRRKERVSHEKVHDGERKCFKVRDTSNTKQKSQITAKAKKSPEKEINKLKKLKKRNLDLDEFSDIFTEPLHVKRFYSEKQNKIEHTLPSKVTKFTKMEKSVNNCSDLRQNHKAKHKELEYFTKRKEYKNIDKPKSEFKTESRNGDSIKLFHFSENRSFKGSSDSLKQKIYHMKAKDGESLQYSVSSKPLSSNIPFSLKSSKKSHELLLRDFNVYHHCMGRHYRLKPSNWNCSSRHALRMLKRKYNTLKLLFNKEPIVHVKKLTAQDVRMKTEESVDDFNSKSMLGKDCKIEFQNLKRESVLFNSSIFSVNSKTVETKTDNLVDPRVMSLSKTLQCGSKGQVGLEKTFKSYHSKPLKRKDKSKMDSQRVSVEKKNKLDWSKWREKLKEASNRMLNKTQVGSGLGEHVKVSNKNDISTLCADSILHLKIPLKSRSEENESKGTESTGKSISRNICPDSDKQEPSVFLADNSDALKEMNEELTLEEYETDSVVGYSINGYSIEIRRDSPVNITWDTKENNAVNECFDEEEMNKILYGDVIDEVTLNCSTKNVEKGINVNNADFSVADDIIPNLCAQDELCFRKSDFSGDEDLSPPVLERLSRSADSIDDEIDDPEFIDDIETNQNFKRILTANECSSNRNENVEYNEINLENNVSNESSNSFDECVEGISDAGVDHIDTSENENSEIENEQTVMFVIENVCSLSGTLETSESNQEEHDPGKARERVVNENEASESVVAEKEANDLTKTCINKDDTEELLACKNLYNEVISKSKCNENYLKSDNLEKKVRNLEGKDLENDNSFASFDKTITVMTDGIKILCKEKLALQKYEIEGYFENDTMCTDVNAQVDEGIEGKNDNQNETVHSEKLRMTKQFENDGQECSENLKTTEIVETIPDVTQTDLNERDDSRKTTCAIGSSKLPTQRRNYMNEGSMEGKDRRCSTKTDEMFKDAAAYVKENGEEQEKISTEKHVEKRTQMRRRNSVRESLGTEDLHAPYSQQSNQTMNEERLMRDFPKHNWLFNKYNITDVAVDTDNVMVSSRRKKKKKKDRKDASRKSTDTNSLLVCQKSCNTASSISQNLGKHLVNKTDLNVEDKAEQKRNKSGEGFNCSDHKNIKIRIRRQSSLPDSRDLLEKNSAVFSQYEKASLDQEQNNDVPDTVSAIKSKGIADKGSDMKLSGDYGNKDGVLQSANDLKAVQTAVDLEIKTKDGDIDFEESVGSMKIRSDIETVKNNIHIHLQSSQDFALVAKAKPEKSEETFGLYEKREMDKGTDKPELGSKLTENLPEAVFGLEFIRENDNDDDDNDDDDEEDVKLKIDESGGLLEGPDADYLALPNSEHSVTDEPVLKPAQSTQESALVSAPDIAELREEEGLELDKKEAGDVGVSPGLMTSPSVIVSVSDTLPSGEVVESKTNNKDYEKEALSDISTITAKSFLLSRTKTGLSDLSTAKSESGSISFRQRTKPPVQLVHPQVHKPAGKVEPVVTSDIQTHGSSASLENKEEAVDVTTGNSFSGITTATASAVPKPLPIPNVAVTSTVVLQSAVLRSAAASQEPGTVLSTSTLSSSPSSHAVTSTSSSSFSNGIVIPIQPFVQCVSTTVQQEFQQNVSQIQSNIVQVQSQSVSQVFQKSPQVHIQNELIPVTKCQTGNITVASNYLPIVTVGNSGKGEMISSQSIYTSQGQPVSYDMNQTQVNNGNLFREMPCKPVHTGPPPLLILPKQTSVQARNRENVQSSYKDNHLNSLAPNAREQFSVSPSLSYTLSKHAEQKPQHLSVCNMSVDSEHINSKETALGKNESSKIEKSVEGLEDEIKKQMEELDREIRRKQQEQEEMKKKKLALLEKIKHSKSVNISQEKDLSSFISDESKIEYTVKEQIMDRNIEQNQLPDSSDKIKESTISSEKTVMSNSEDLQEEQVRPCKSVVMSKLDDEKFDEYDSSAPMDLSSAIKSNHFIIGNISGTNCDISVSENTNVGDLLMPDSSGVHETSDQLESENEREESELSCIDDDEAVLRDRLSSKSDGINYIEDIGLVNPFTGEYEINEDVEGVEYLDLSAKSDDRLDDKNVKDTKDFASDDMNKKIENENVDNTKSVNKYYKKQSSENHEKDIPQISSESYMTSTEDKTNVSRAECVSVNNRNNQTSLINSLTRSITTVLSPSISSVTSTVQESATTTITKSSSDYPCDTVAVKSPNRSANLSCTDENATDLEKSTSKKLLDISCIEDAPLNLHIVKTSACETNSQRANSISKERRDSDGKIQAAQEDTLIQHRIQPQTSSINRENSSSLKPQVSMHVHVEHPGLASKVCGKSPMNNTPISSLADSPIVPHLQHSSSKVNKSSEEMHQVQPGLNTVVTVVETSDNANQEKNHTETLNKQSYRNNTNDHNSRGMIQKRCREKNMEIKPAHYRSPPRKIQKGAKPMPAHCQKATSRETMKKMCKSPLINPHTVQNTSPYLLKKYPIFLGPREVDKPFPRMWEKKSPKPAHSKRPFGIAGHLIVSTARKKRKRTVSGEVAQSPAFYSLPNTPTSPRTMPPRATSVDYHGSVSPSQMTFDTQQQASLTSISASDLKEIDNHGGQDEFPSPIRAHCRPKSQVLSDRFYETSVLRPPALLRSNKFRSKNEKALKDHSEIIDLTAETDISDHSSVESLRSKEQTIQNELNHAVLKRQRFDGADTEKAERNVNTEKNTAFKSKHIMNRIAMMPPPPYVGRQRMPVLLQVPRDRAVFEQTQRFPFDRRIDGNQVLFERSSAQTSIHSPQTQIDVRTVNEPQTRQQMLTNPYSDSNQDPRLFGSRPVQTGNHHVNEMKFRNYQFTPNQSVTHMRGVPKQMLYSQRGTNQTQAGPGMVSPNMQQEHVSIGNSRIQHPNIPQQSYIVRGQNLQYPGYQTQTQIHQLLQQPRTFTSQIKQRGETSPKVMQMEDSNPQNVQRRETNPRMLVNTNVSHRTMQERLSSQMIQNADLHDQAGHAMQGRQDTQVIQRADLNVHAGHAMQTSNVPVMPGGDMNQTLENSPRNRPQIMQANNLRPQMLNPRCAEQRGQMYQTQMDSHLHGSDVAVQPILTQEQRLQQMQQIRAQHIRSQQLRTLSPKVGFEPVTRMPGIRTQQAMSHPSVGNKTSPIQAATYQQQMGLLENQMNKTIQSHPRPVRPENVSTGPPIYPLGVNQRQPLIIAPRPQQGQFHQKNMPVMASYQQNSFIRTPVFISSPTIQCHPSAAVDSSAETQSTQTQGQIANLKHASGVTGDVQAYKAQNVIIASDFHSVANQGNGNLPGRVQQSDGSTAAQFESPNQDWHEQNIRDVCKASSNDFSTQGFQAQPIAACVKQNTNSTAEYATDENAARLQPLHLCSQSMPAVSGDINLAIAGKTAHSHEITSVQRSWTSNIKSSSNLDQSKSQEKINSVPLVEENMPHLQQVHGECVICGKYSLYLCSNCKKIWYCSPDCQLTHWQTHANECEGQPE